MKKFSFYDLAALIIWLLPVCYLLWIYKNMPAIVPLHFGFDGRPDRFGAKREFLSTAIILPSISALFYLLLKFLPSIDPKRKVKYSEQTFQKVGLGMIVFMSGLFLCITISAVNKSFKFDKLILPMMGLLFVFLGNMINSIKPNYFVGVRTPWTLENEDTWRATHRLAGKLYFVGGIFIIIAALVLTDPVMGYVLGPGVALMVLIPVVYSYIYFKKHQLK